jgi:5-methylcytosine-specific restriction endonuclease McrA
MTVTNADAVARYRARHPGRVLACGAAYRMANAEMLRAKARTYDATHGSERMAYRATYADLWASARHALNNSRVRARKFGLDPGHLTTGIFARLHLLPCAYCGQMPALGADHVVPLGRGGSNEMENLVPACLSCNKHKSDNYQEAMFA